MEKFITPLELFNKKAKRLEQLSFSEKYRELKNSVSIQVTNIQRLIGV